MAQGSHGFGATQPDAIIPAVLANPNPHTLARYRWSAPNCLGMPRHAVRTANMRLTPASLQRTVQQYRQPVARLRQLPSDRVERCGVVQNSQIDRRIDVMEIRRLTLAPADVHAKEPSRLHAGQNPARDHWAVGRLERDIVRFQSHLTEIREVRETSELGREFCIQGVGQCRLTDLTALGIPHDLLDQAGVPGGVELMLPESTRCQAVSAGIGIGGAVQRLMQIAHEMNDELELLACGVGVQSVPQAIPGFEIGRHECAIGR
jgi:hypothetical protein